MLNTIEVGQLDDATGLALRAGASTEDPRRHDLVADRRERFTNLDRLLQPERHAGRRALVAERAQPLDVARARTRPRFATDNYPVERLSPFAIRQTCWYVIP